MIITQFRKIIVMVILASNVGISQLNFNISYNGYYDDNLFRSPETVKDLISDIGIGANYKIKDTGFYIHNNLDILKYQDNANRDFVLNNLGFSNQVTIGENQLSNLYFGGNWNLRINQNDYNYYNYSQIFGYTNIQIFTKISLIKGGYNYRYRDYSNWSNLSNHLHNAYLQINKSFPTRTTIILETGFGNKSFTGKDSIITTTTTGQGRGHRSGTTKITNELEKALNTSQINLTFRLTQSITEKTGVYIQYLKQISVNDEISYQNFDDYYQDDELFDDPFTYESNNYSSQLTFMFPKQTKIVFKGSYSDKKYISEIAFSDEIELSEIDVLRKDEQLRFYTNISKTFIIKKDWINSIKFDLTYVQTNNESNSYWYNYDNSIISGGMRINF